jgi:hypothetical protein
MYSSEKHHALKYSYSTTHEILIELPVPAPYHSYANAQYDRLPNHATDEEPFGVT